MEIFSSKNSLSSFLALDKTYYLLLITYYLLLITYYTTAIAQQAIFAG